MKPTKPNAESVGVDATHWMDKVVAGILEKRPDLAERFGPAFREGVVQSRRASGESEKEAETCAHAFVRNAIFEAAKQTPARTDMDSSWLEESAESILERRPDIRARFGSDYRNKVVNRLLAAKHSERDAHQIADNLVRNAIVHAARPPLRVKERGHGWALYDFAEPEDTAQAGA